MAVYEVLDMSQLNISTVFGDSIQEVIANGRRELENRPGGRHFYYLSWPEDGMKVRDEMGKVLSPNIEARICEVREIERKMRSPAAEGGA